MSRAARQRFEAVFTQEAHLRSLFQVLMPDLPQR